MMHRMRMRCCASSSLWTRKLTQASTAAGFCVLSTSPRPSPPSRQYQAASRPPPGSRPSIGTSLRRGACIGCLVCGVLGGRRRAGTTPLARSISYATHLQAQGQGKGSQSVGSDDRLIYDPCHHTQTGGIDRGGLGWARRPLVDPVDLIDCSLLLLILGTGGAAALAACC